MKLKMGIFFLVLAALAFLFTAIAHLSCLYFGPECYAAQLAPKEIVDSAIKGTYLAPTLNLIVSAVFIVLGLYAFSSARIIGQLPFCKTVVYSASILCIVRGVLPIQLFLRYPERVDDAHINFGIGWLVTGLLLLIGSAIVNKKYKSSYY